MKFHNPIQFGTVTLVCTQAAFLFPYVILIHGERTNLFTPSLTLFALCILWLTSAVAHAEQMERKWNTWEPYAWSALGTTVMLSGYLSPEQTASLYRAFAFFAPALAGYWCGRIISCNNMWLKYCTYFFTGLFLALSIGQLIHGQGQPFISVHHHAMANILIVLAVGPLSLFVRARTLGIKAVYLGILSLGFLATYVIGSRFSILLPFTLVPFFIGFGSVRKRYITVVAILFLIVAALFFAQRPSKTLRLHNYESVFYRVEGIPTAIHIVKQHPVFGIGLRASREPYLKDYEIHSDLTDKDNYMRVVKNNVTSDNMLSTMAVGLGLLPTLIYAGMLAAYARRLTASLKNSREDGFANSMIGLSLICCIIHFSIQDGLLYPQVSWYFHLLIGLIPLRRNANVPE